MPDPKLPASADRLRLRQSRTLLALGAVLAAGAAAALLIRRLPLPLRLELAFGDLVAASALLLFRHQNYRDRRG
jgi:hypothetical protein